MESIILIGGGGHCRSSIDVIETEGRFMVAGIIDIPEKIGDIVLGYNVIASDDDLPSLARQYKYFFITLGQIGLPGKRVDLFTRLKDLRVSLPVIKSPFAYVSKHATIGAGTIIMHHSVVNANAVVGENCIVNTKSLIEHDVTIGNHVHVATGALINGGVTVGDNSFIGSGAICKQYISLPGNTFIKANSIVK
jgi:sugar O-acyltransferase (sialic acid O-acetyltransferase NeuD family)